MIGDWDVDVRDLADPVRVRRSPAAGGTASCGGASPATPRPAIRCSVRAVPHPVVPQRQHRRADRLARVEALPGSRRFAFSSETLAWAAMPFLRCSRPCWKSSYVSLSASPLMPHLFGKRERTENRPRTRPPSGSACRRRRRTARSSRRASRAAVEAAESGPKRARPSASAKSVASTPALVPSSVPSSRGATLRGTSIPWSRRKSTTSCRQAPAMRRGSRVRKRERRSASFAPTKRTASPSNPSRMMPPPRGRGCAEPLRRRRHPESASMSHRLERCVPGRASRA